MVFYLSYLCVFFFKQKTAYEMRISDWSSDVCSSDLIAKEEVFGPVATVMAYDDLDQAVDIANDTEYGLSAVVSGDPAKAAEVAPKLRAGMVAVTAWGSGPGAPFGGYNASGTGRCGELGTASCRERGCQSA